MQFVKKPFVSIFIFLPLFFPLSGFASPPNGSNIPRYEIKVTKKRFHFFTATSPSGNKVDILEAVVELRNETSYNIEGYFTLLAHYWDGKAAHDVSSSGMARPDLRDDFRPSSEGKRFSLEPGERQSLACYMFLPSDKPKPNRIRYHAEDINGRLMRFFTLIGNINLENQDKNPTN